MSGGKQNECVICGRPAGGRYRAFCSQRCADQDLAKWFGETYRVPLETPPANEDEIDGSEAD